MARVARSAVALAAAFGVILAATGWLYLARPHLALPGPLVRDVLPLDELAGNAPVPLLLFLGVWIPAALLLGLLARWARTERLTAALLLAFGVGAVLYLVNGLSILIVRQVPANAAFRAAAIERAVFFPAVIAGLAGASLGRACRSSRPRSPLLLGVAVAAVGLLGVLDAVVPQHGSSFLASLAPEAAYGISEGLVAPLSIALVVAARGLARRQHRAWQVALGLLSVLIVLHAARRFDEGAIVAGVAMLALVARRGDFGFRGDPAAKPRILLHAGLAAAVIASFGVVTLWINRLMADQDFTFGFALRTTARAAVGLSLRHAAHLSGALAEWFPVSTFALFVGASGFLLFEWLAPWRYRLVAEARERERVRAILARYGADTLAPFALRSDKSYFFGEDERSFLAYRVVGGVAIVAGDPVGPHDDLPALLAAFIEFAHARGWRLAVLGASSASLDLYRARGLHAVYHGDEAVVETAAFSLEGRAVRKVRQSCHRLERAGFRARVLRPGELGPELRAELAEIARAWRGGEPERGFAMALDALFRLGDDEAVFVVGEDAAGRPQGFLHFAVCRAGSAVSLSSMPRLRTTPNGFNEWLIVSAVEWARGHGFERVSLNFAPFASLLAPEAELTLPQRAGRRALLAMKGHFQLDNLLLFNRKFFPTWQPRFVVVERRLDLPRVGVAALAAESYLPFVAAKPDE
jgi:lysyl-tRNA synthetase, class II